MKDSAILVRLEATEHNRLSQVAALDGRPLAQWARRQLIAAADKTERDVELAREPDDDEPAYPVVAAEAERKRPTPKRKPQKKKRRR